MSHKKQEKSYTKGTYDDICEVKKDLVDNLKAQIGAVGFGQMDTMETGQVIDMIKDLAEAEKACMEACYYEKIVEAMEEASEEDEEGRMGYNSRHYASGRFAPKGRGTRMGYMPDLMMPPQQYPYIYGYMEDPEFEHKMRDRMGYQPSGAGNRSQSGSRMGYEDWDLDPDDDPRQSKEYNEYKRAKRHYTTTKSPADKQQMDEHMTKHMNQAMDSFREIWKDADPTMRKRMKADLTALIGEMPT